MFSLRRPSVDDLRQRRLVIGLGAMKCGTTWLSDYLGRHPESLIRGRPDNAAPLDLKAPPRN